MKKITKTLIKIVIILIVFEMINVPVANAGFWDEIIDSGNSFVSNGKNEAQKDSDINDATLKDITDQIYNSLLVIGIFASVLIGGILGIQIMWGSIEQQVKAKEMLMPYAAGCIVVFGAFGIWKLCVTIFSHL